ncbi:class I SAM-dependent methyltransferase [Streptomyces sp. GbtcB6]|uniref:class I SAM-dependent methyltransferase n=1 Tax=Streptomyces sp. GbtcB6 TaxID=2824751 RepID=UPI0020C603FB|nr:class I SAM-dependent methyltransferase [Streptomyces sp. GbtcB6]
MPEAVLKAYVMGQSTEESNRLGVQDSLYAEHTEYLLRTAGVREGMRVLDVGCGTGAVSLALARIVGPDGHVTGVDMDPAVLAIARRNAAALSTRNVAFEQAVLPDVELSEPVDAVVGRLILIHVDDPVGVVKGLTRSLRRGGLVTFQDFNVSRLRAFPEVPLVTQCQKWISAALTAGGRNPDMGEQLARVLRAAGLSEPGVACAVPTGGADSAAVTLVAESVNSLMPVIERNDIADPREVDIDTLHTRLAKACLERQATIYLPDLVAAWARAD